MKDLSPELREIVYEVFAPEGDKMRYHNIGVVSEYYTQEQRDSYVEKAMGEVNFPIIQLCKWMLVNDIEQTDKNTWNFTCGVDFMVKVEKHFDINVVKVFPDITETSNEYKLVNRCAEQGIINTRERVKQSERDKVGEFLKGECVCE